MGAHAALSLSAAERWMNCAGAPALEALAIGDGSSPESISGSASHDVVAWALTHGVPTVELRSYIGKTVAEITGSEEFSENSYDEARYESNAVYLDFVNKLKGGSVIDFVEHTVKIMTISYDLWGTLDFGCVREEDGELVLHIVDYKDGFGLVEVEENAQMSCYGLGSVEDFPHYKFDRVEFHIVQPRAFHPIGKVRTFVASAAYLEEFRNSVITARERIKHHPHTYTSGPHCKWCKGWSRCPALRRDIDAAADLAIGATDEISVSEMGKLLDKRDSIVGAFDKMADRVTAVVEQGGAVRGSDGYRWVVKDRTSNKRWTAKAAADVDKEPWSDDAYESKFKSPAQVAKLGKASREWVKDHTYRCKIGTKLQKEKPVVEADAGEFGE